MICTAAYIKRRLTGFPIIYVYCRYRTAKPAKSSADPDGLELRFNANFRQFEQTHSMENVIYNELKMQGYNVDAGVVPIGERGKDGKVIRKQLEVDFVCSLGSKRYYVQSAYSIPDTEKLEQKIRPYKKIDDSFRKIIVTKDIVHANYDENGILTVNIYDFLLNENTMDM